MFLDKVTGIATQYLLPVTNDGTVTVGWIAVQQASPTPTVTPTPGSSTLTLNPLADAVCGCQRPSLTPLDDKSLSNG